MNIGERIYKYRTGKNLSQGDLAEMLDVSRQSVSKWENNSAIPDLDKIVKLCEIFEVSIDELVKGKAGVENSVNINKKTQPENSVQTAQSTYQEDASRKASNTGFPGRKIAGTILFCMAFLIILVFTMLAGIGVGFFFAVPFIVCGIICFIFKQNVGLWCAWAIYFMLDMYLRMATGVNKSIIYHTYYYTLSDNSATLHLIIGWTLYIILAVLTLLTVLRFKNKPLEMTRKTRNLLFIGIGIAVIIKLLQIVLPTSAYYSYYLAHIISLESVHTIIFGLIDWVKVGVVVALVATFARYRFQVTSIAYIGIVVLSIFINLVANFNITQSEISSDEGNHSIMNEITTRDKSIYDHGLDIVAMLEEITHSEEYIQAFSSSADIIATIKNIGEGDYTTPQTVYKITFDMDNVLKTSDMLDLENASDTLINNLKGRVINSIITGINSRSGVTALAATSVCATGKTFVSNELQEEMIYLYTFSDAVPVAVAFTTGENNTVTASGNFLLYDELSAGSVQELLEYFGAYSVEIEVVTD